MIIQPGEDANRQWFGRGYSKVISLGEPNKELAIRYKVTAPTQGVFGNIDQELLAREKLKAALCKKPDVDEGSRLQERIGVIEHEWAARGVLVRRSISWPQFGIRKTG